MVRFGFLFGRDEFIFTLTIHFTRHGLSLKDRKFIIVVEFILKVRNCQNILHPESRRLAYLRTIKPSRIDVRLDGLMAHI